MQSLHVETTATARVVGDRSRDAWHRATVPRYGPRPAFTHHPPAPGYRSLPSNVAEDSGGSSCTRRAARPAAGRSLGAGGSTARSPLPKRYLVFPTSAHPGFRASARAALRGGSDPAARRRRYPCLPLSSPTAGCGRYPTDRSRRDAGDVVWGRVLRRRPADGSCAEALRAGPFPVPDEATEAVPGPFSLPGCEVGKRRYSRRSERAFAVTRRHNVMATPVAAGSMRELCRTWHRRAARRCLPVVRAGPVNRAGSGPLAAAGGPHAKSVGPRA